MPYYQCPKCGGRDTYEGTELVSGSVGGGAIIGPENDLGYSPVVGVRGKSATSEQTVTKCKSCDIILGRKDYFYSPDEWNEYEKDRVVYEGNPITSNEKKFYIGTFLFIAVLIALIVFANL